MVDAADRELAECLTADGDASAGTAPPTTLMAPAVRTAIARPARTRLLAGAFANRGNRPLAMTRLPLRAGSCCLQPRTTQHGPTGCNAPGTVTPCRPGHRVTS